MDIWLPPKPAIIRPATKELLKPKQAALHVNQLIGFGVNPATPPITSLSFINSAQAASPNFTYPASILAGDLLIAWDWAVYPPVATVPSGFTSLASLPGITGAQLVVSYRIADGTETGTVAGMNGKYNLEAKFMLHFRGDNPPVLVTTPGVNYQSTTANPSAQVVSASGQPTPLLVLAEYIATSSVTVRSFSPAADAELTIDATTFMKYKIYNASPANVTVDMNDNGTNDLSSGLFLVS